MKVLIIAKAYPPDVGGVQSYSEFIARAYLKAGVTPVVVSLFDDRRGWHELTYPEGTVRLFNVGPGSQPAVFLRMLKACARVLRAEKIDFLHPTTWRPALAILHRMKHYPTVLTVHGQEVLNYPGLAKNSMVKILTRANLVVTVSDSTMEVARGALFGHTSKGQWEVDFNGLSYIDLARAFDRPERPKDAPLRLLSFARLAERKNIHGCLHALAMLRDEGLTNFQYTIAGGGPMKAEIAALIETLKLGDLATMAGYVEEEDIPDLYRNADVFLHPQTAPQTGKDLEGFGLAIADSISFGAVAIVGDAGGPKDFVKDEERGLVVNGESTDEIARALRRVMTDPELRRRLAETGRSWCLENLSWDRHVAQILDNLSAQKLIQPRAKGDTT